MEEARWAGSWRCQLSASSRVGQWQDFHFDWHKGEAGVGEKIHRLGWAKVGVAEVWVNRKKGVERQVKMKHRCRVEESEREKVCVRITQVTLEEKVIGIGM